MKPINFKKIKKGDYSELMKGIGCLVDAYKEDKFDLGYQCCLADMEVYAERLAKKIYKSAVKSGNFVKDKNEEITPTLSKKQTTKIIKEYFNKLNLKNK